MLLLCGTEADDSTPRRLELRTRGRPRRRPKRSARRPVAARWHDDDRRDSAARPLRVARPVRIARGAARSGGKTWRPRCPGSRWRWSSTWPRRRPNLGCPPSCLSAFSVAFAVAAFHLRCMVYRLGVHAHLVPWVLHMHMRHVQVAHAFSCCLASCHRCDASRVATWGRGA